MGKMLFGTAGVPVSSKGSDSVSGIRRIVELGLDAMEVEFVYGVKMKPASAREVGKAQKETGVRLSVHAPYYINLNSKEAKKVRASQQRILQSARIGELCNATIVVLHPGFYMGMEPGKAYEKVRTNIAEVREKLDREGTGIRLGLETTGKGSQFGTVEEIVRISKEVKGVFPAIDFSHIHARGNGCLKTKKDFETVIGKVKKGGSRFLKQLHFHASGINYSAKGELNHLNLKDRTNDFNYRFMVDGLKKFGVGGTVICESPNLEVDALLMKKYYRK